MEKIISITKTSENEIKKFFENDILDFRLYPDAEIASEYKKPQKKVYMVDTSVIKSDVKRKEYKDYLYCIYVDKNFNISSDKLSYIFLLPQHINDARWDSIISYNDKEDLEALNKYFTELGRNYKPIINPLLKQMKSTLVEFYDTRKGLNRDIWHAKDLNIAKERINKSSGCSSINFSLIPNIHNRELVKMYYRNLIGNTELTFSTLINIYTKIKEFCCFLGDKFLEDVERADFTAFIDSLGTISANKNNKIVNSISDLYKYLAVKETYKKENPIIRKDYKKESRKHHNNNVSDYVLIQIFKRLFELPFELLLMYLINYSTGMRVSDICQLETNCLIKSEKCCFIRFYIQKLQKDHAVPISSALGELIQKRIENISSLGYKEKYLFHRDRNEPRKTKWYTEQMKRWCKQWDIKNEDGTTYKFKSHAYRHTIATDLFKNYNVDLEVIQLAILGHACVQMSLCYIDESDDYKQMINDKYINNAGGFTLLESKNSLQPGWIKENLNKQMLPNGICSYPTALGVCPNADVCIECDFFRTSKRFLDVHKNHLLEIEKQIQIYESNGWINNLKTSKKQREILLKIIKSLEE